MKFVFILSFLLSSIAMAAPVCHEMPEGMKYDKFETNYDGSVYIENPQLFAGGDYLQLTQSSAEGVCTLLKKKHVSFTGRHSSPQSKKVVALWENGEIQGIHDISDSALLVIWYIICR